MLPNVLPPSRLTFQPYLRGLVLRPLADVALDAQFLEHEGLVVVDYDRGLPGAGNAPGTHRGAVQPVLVEVVGHVRIEAAVGAEGVETPVGPGHALQRATGTEFLPHCGSASGATSFHRVIYPRLADAVELEHVVAPGRIAEPVRIR